MLLHVLQSVEKEKDRCSSAPCFFLLASCFIITIVDKKIKSMTYKEANNISIKDYLNSLGIQPVTEKGSYGMYRSPLREDNTPSFKVDYNANLWCDYGTGEGGTLIDLVMKQHGCNAYGAICRLEQGNTASFSFHGKDLPERDTKRQAADPDRDTQNTAVTESGTHALFAGKGDFSRNGSPIRTGNVLPYRWKALFCAGVQE